MREPSKRPHIGDEENQDKYFGIELASIESLLQFYCRALVGKEIDICHGESDSILAYRNIWWSQLKSGLADKDLVRVSLPASFLNYPTYAENFSWYKSAVTQQIGHVEFGSFDFLFAKKSTLFEDLRFDMESEAKTEVSPLTRFFCLFDDRLLAAQIFIAAENTRVNFLVKHFYPGIKPGYVKMQQSVVHALQQLPAMSLRRAFCEMLETLEFDETATLRIDALEEPLHLAGEIIGKLYSTAVTVEDTAEATIRIYNIARKIPKNMIVSTSGEYDAENREPDLIDLEAQEYIGNFETDQLKLNMEMRSKTGQSSTMPMTAEDLQKLGDQKVGISDISDAQFLSSTGLSVADLPRGVHIYQFSQTKYQQVDRYQPKDTGLPITPEEGEKLFNYEEWDFRAKRYLPEWCCIREKVLGEGSSYFYEKTLESQKILASELKRQFEKLPAELLYKAKNLDDGDEYDLDLVISELIDRRAGHTPSGKVYWKKKKIQRDVAVVFLLDMSGSTADLISKSKTPMQYDESIKYDFIKFCMQPRRRIIDVEKESIVLLMNAIETLGDTYGIYGFSGHGRSKVQFLVIKDLNEVFTEKIKRRVDQIAPIHGTRMGPAVRHAVSKLDAFSSSLKLLFLVSDGYPQDSMYGWDDDDKEYAIHDTKMALLEASKKNITPFCLTVDSSGNDYLRTMCQDIGYEVLDDIEALPQHLPMLYKKLSV